MHWSRLVVMVVPLVVAACGKPPAAAPAPRSLSTEIAAADGERHLTNVRQVTFGGNNAESYWSKSGKQLIFQHQDVNDQGCDQEYIMNADGSGLRRVSNGKGRTTCGYFWDNDRRILYSSSFAFDPACPPPVDRSAGYVWPLDHLEIYTSRADGSDLKALTGNGAYNAETTVSPDGKKIVWRAGYPETAKDSADYLDLLHRRLVRPSKVELWVANADGSDKHQITHLGGANFAPFFTPDGTRIIFGTNFKNPRSRNFDLYLVKIDGTGLEQVTTDPEFDGFPMFSPDGRQLVWASNRHAARMGDTNLFIADWVP